MNLRQETISLNPKFYLQLSRNISKLMMSLFSLTCIHIHPNLPKKIIISSKILLIKSIYIKV